MGARGVLEFRSTHPLISPQKVMGNNTLQNAGEEIPQSVLRWKWRGSGVLQVRTCTNTRIGALDSQGLDIPRYTEIISKFPCSRHARFACQDVPGYTENTL